MNHHKKNKQLALSLALADVQSFKLVDANALELLDILGVFFYQVGAKWDFEWVVSIGDHWPGIEGTQCAFYWVSLIGDHRIDLRPLIMAYWT